MLNRRNVLEGRNDETIALAANGADKIKAIPWPSIRTDGGTQMRVGMSQETIDRYAEDMSNGDVFPALIVYLDSRGSYWLADGFHRYQAHRQAFGVGKPILCKVESGEKRDAVLYSAKANSKHGLPRTPEDKRFAVDTLLKDADWSKWSDREIARACAVSNTFVGDRRKLLTVNVDSEKTYTTKHGTVATMRTNGIGKRSAQPPTDTPKPPTPTPLTLDETKAMIYRVILVDGRSDDPADMLKHLVLHFKPEDYIHSISKGHSIDNDTFFRQAYPQVRAELQERAKSQPATFKADPTDPNSMDVHVKEFTFALPPKSTAPQPEANPTAIVLELPPIPFPDKDLLIGQVKRAVGILNDEGFATAADLLRVAGRCAYDAQPAQPTTPTWVAGEPYEKTGSGKPSREFMIDLTIKVFKSAMDSLDEYGQLTGHFPDVPQARRILEKMVGHLKENITT